MTKTVHDFLMAERKKVIGAIRIIKGYNYNDVAKRHNIDDLVHQFAEIKEMLLSENPDKPLIYLMLCNLSISESPYGMSDKDTAKKYFDLAMASGGKGEMFDILKENFYPSARKPLFDGREYPKYHWNDYGMEGDYEGRILASQETEFD